MGKIIDNIRQRLASIIGPAQKRESASEVGGGTIRTGSAPMWMYYSPTAPWNVSTVYACVRLLSESVANLDMEYLNKDESGVFRPQRYGKLWFLMNVQASPTMGGFDFRQRMVTDLLVWGNAYVVPRYSSVLMDFDRLVLVRPWCVSYNGTTGKYAISDPYEGLQGEFDEDEVIHVKNPAMTGDPRVGMSVVTYAMRSIDVANAGGTETLNRILNGGDVRGVVGNDRTIRGVGKYQDQQLAFVAEDLEEKFRAGTRIVHLPGSVDFKQLSMSSVDMQFLENRRFAAQDICQFFGVNPNLITGEGQSAYKSATEMVTMYMLTTLNPLLRKIENEFTRKLIPEDKTPWRKIEFNREGIYGCDPMGRLEYMRKMQELGLGTVNELRSRAGIAASETDGADAVLVSANLKPLTELTEKNGEAE